MINSETRKLLHDYYQSHTLFRKSFILAVVVFKFSDLKPINQSI